MPHNYQIIKQNLLLTQKYCELRLANSTFDNAAIFRSIDPQYAGRPLFTYTKGAWGDFNIVEWTKDPYVLQNETLLLELFEYQLDIKQTILQEENSNDEFSKEGNIFAFLINDTLIDGAAAHASEGILDDYNCPPIDTWFHILYTDKGPILLAWIPAFFTNLVNDGIDVNPEECIQWLNVWYPEICVNILY